ncbi:uncharacterized protein TNCV_2694411 [Trichonephila clavipes]|nr:uncharacterized protein TNCV_2694411 [Trichonephila clavipes]
MKSFIGNRKIHINFRNCQSYQVVDEKIQSNINEDLCCTSHEEADTKIIYHACNVAEKSNIVIRGSDTDILIIMIVYLSALQCQKSKDVDDGRFQLFVSSYKASDVHENFTKKVQHFDATSIPPCKIELYQQFLRAHYISTIWKNAYKKTAFNFGTIEYGWIEQDNTFILKWFEGDQLPSFVRDLITNIPESDSIDDEDDLYNDEHYPDDDE